MVGTWLQNVVVAPFALDLTRSASNPKGSASFVGLLTVAQLGPLLLLSIPGGVLANRVDRKKLMIGAQSVQSVAAFGLALVAWKATHADAGAAIPLGIGVFIGVLAPPFFYPFSRTVWSAIDLGMTPLEPAELADAAEHRHC